MSLELTEIELAIRACSVPRIISDLFVEGIRRSKKIDCFGFVASNPCLLYSLLSNLKPTTFCEWGSGIGIGLAIAEHLGFESIGIELNGPLSDAARQLLKEFGFRSEIKTGSYYELESAADYYFTYCWPGQMKQMEAHFLNATAADARLMYCEGADDIRMMMKTSTSGTSPG